MIGRKIAGATLAAGCAIAILSGCSATTDEETAATPSTTTLPATEEPVEDDHPGADPNALTDATKAATDAVSAYCRPGLSKDEWMATLAPLLTEKGVIAYETVNPVGIPCTTVTGPATVRDGDDAFVFRINVPTDAGTYEVYVTRAQTADPWKVERMAPPA